MMVERAPKVHYDDIQGDTPADLSNMPGEIVVDSDLNLNDRNQRRRFRRMRMISEKIEWAKENGKDLLALPQPSRKVKLIIGVGTAVAAAAIGARILHKHRQQKDKK